MRKIALTTILFLSISSAFAQTGPGLVAPNQVVAGPNGGGVSQPASGRALVGADLPNPSASTIGGVESITCASHQWLNTISIAGAPACAQPATSDISGLGTIATQNANAVAISGGTVTGLPSPSVASDAATKQYVDNATVGLIVHTQALLATAAVLPANTYNNGSSGVGATLTGNSNGALTVDGVLTTTSIRVVVKNEAAPANNGIYTVTTVGSGGAPYVLTRGTDANTPGTGNPNSIGFGSYVFITSGTANANTGWSVTSTVTTIGTSAINWAQFSSSAPVTVSNSDGTLTISPTSGNIVASLALGHANPWTAAQTFQVSGNAAIINTPSTSQQGCIPFQSAGTTKWTLCKNTDDSINFTDIASGNVDFNIQSNGNMRLMVNGGSLFAGNSIYADNSGHPYCDVRNFGAGLGTPSVDQTSIANALSACSGGYVFIPCGAYGNTAPWTVPAFTTVRGAARACVSIVTTQSAGDIFVCGSGGTNGPKPIEMSEMQLYGVGYLTTGSVPTAGYAINCQLGGNQQSFYDLYISGTFNGIYIGGAGGRLRDSRLETLYGPVMINAPVGGNLIDGNQLDSNSNFNATGGAGFGTFITYNTSTPVVVTTGTMTQSGGNFFIATVGGTTAPLGGGIPATPIYKNITDGSVTWQMVGNNNLYLVIAGTEGWITDNDMTSPANVGIGLAGGNSANKNWIRGNNLAGEVAAGIYLTGGVAYNHITDNQFSQIGYALGSTPTGWAINDAGGGNNIFTVITGNTFATTTDAAMIVRGDYWNIASNSISHNTKTTQYCGIQMFTSGATPIGTNITGNNIFNQSPGPICMSGGGGSNSIFVGNGLFGGTISYTGSAVSAGNL